MIIFGTKGTAKLLGVLAYVCGICGNEAAQRLVERKRWFTLFFIPLIPFSTKHVITCAFCGGGTEIDTPTVQRFVADSEHAAAARSEGGQPA